MLTLWDLIEPIVKRRAKRRADARAEKSPPVEKQPVELRALIQPKADRAVNPPAVEPFVKNDVAERQAAQPNARRRNRVRVDGAAGGEGLGRIDGIAGRESAQDRYMRVANLMLAKYDVRVRKWRTSMSGIAWYVTYRDGRISRLIEAPKPKGPMSIAVFLHEIGHHAIGFNRYKPRCLEEYHAWAWAIAAMEEHGLNVTDAVRYRMHASLWYAVSKAKRRGIKEIPAELAPYLERPVKVTDVEEKG